MNSKLDIYKSYTDQSDLGSETPEKVYILIQLKNAIYLFCTPVKDVLFYACLCMSLCLYVCLCL